MNVVELVLIDLDGTLVDTSEDLAASANRLRDHVGLPAVDVTQVIRWVGDGARMLVARTMEIAESRVDEDPAVDEGLDFFRAHYREHMLDRARPYPGVPEGLSRLAAAGRTMAVVSNKPVAMCVEILEKLDLAHRFVEVLGGDSLPIKKPDPEPLRTVMRRTGTRSERTAMIGDAAQDVLAGRAAGCTTVAALYGFRTREELLPAAPDHMIDRFEDALPLLGIREE